MAACIGAPPLVRITGEIVGIRRLIKSDISFVIIILILFVTGIYAFLLFRNIFHFS